MKAILICPNQANGIPVLADSKPLVTLPFLGESFISYWLEHFASAKVKDLKLITTDSASDITHFTGTGSRWGVKIEVFHEVRELSVAEARKRYRSGNENDWVPEPNDVVIADHFPGVPGHKVFESYRAWFQAMSLWVPQSVASRRIGFKEVAPGIWMGHRTKVARTAKLTPPCWIGDQVRIGSDASVGPMTFLEDRVVIDERAIISHSWVGPDTFLGTMTELRDSLAWGILLINWKTGSHTTISDPFLLASLAENRSDNGKKQTLTTGVLKHTSKPFDALIALANKLQG
jgi:NDP-sugar pyrophosphorylase family protein